MVTPNSLIFFALKVNSQLTLSCFFDDLIYKTELTTAVSETQIGACKESYAFLSDSTKVLTTKFFSKI